VGRSDVSAEVSAYLRELDAALSNVPPTIASEIHDGIAEELGGLPAEVVRERIRELGDPRFVAAQALDGLETEVTPTRPPEIVSSRIYAAASAIVVAFGAFAVPMVGWAFGYVLVLLSPLWRRWEKMLAIAVPVGASALVALTFAAMDFAPAGSWETYSLLAAGHVALSNAAVTVAVSNAIAGTWLLVRALTRH